MEQRSTRRTMLTGLVAGLGSLALGRRMARGFQQDPNATPEATPGALAHPTGTDELVLRIEVGGGFVPREFLITAMPQFSVYGDGRVIFLGPQPEIHPPPALPNIRVLRLTAEGVQRILQAAADAGLIGASRHYTNNAVADAPTTVVTVNAGDQTTIVSAYALGFGADPDRTARERQELARLKEFVQRMTDLTAWLPQSVLAEQETAYQIERLQVIATPASPSFGRDDAATATPTPPLDWPLATPPSTFGAPFDALGLQNARCADVSGDELATLLSALETASLLTPWQSDDQTYTLLLRPLLPDEAPCMPPERPPGRSADATPEA